MEILQIVWFFLIAALFLGYAILDGFDLGVGMLTPFLAKDDDDRRVLFNAVGPVWDGNEVWLLTGGGALFAAFPMVYATVFSGFYLALMLVLFALVFRAVSLEFWSYDEGRRPVWMWSFVIGSFLPALLYGVVLGNVIQGVPLDHRFDFAGDFFTLLRPFPLACGLLGLGALLLQGATFTVLKSEGALRGRAKRLTWLIGWGFLLVFSVTVVLGILCADGWAGRDMGWVFMVVVLVFWTLMMKASRGETDGLTFLFSSLIQAGLWGLIAAVMFPLLLRASNDASLHMSIYNSSSGRLTLTVMLIIALVGMPVVVGYTIFVYRVFRGKVRPRKT